MRSILACALSHFVKCQQDRNPDLIADYYTAFSNSAIDTEQALNGLAKLVTELGIYLDAENETVSPELLVNIGLNLKNNLDCLHLSQRGLEITSDFLNLKRGKDE